MLGRIVRLALAAVGLYLVWPSVVEVFGSYDQLAAIRPWWFAVMAVLEFASFVCVWLLIGISTSSSHWLLIATSQLVSNSVSSIVPGGAAAGGPLQYNYMVRGGEEPARTASGLVAVSLLTTTALFGLAALCVPLSFRLAHIDARLERASWLGAGAFLILLLLGFAAFTTDGLLRTLAGATQWVLNHVRRRKPRSADMPQRVLEQRDRVRQALGSHWSWAVITVVSRWAFDYFALVAAVAATGSRVESVPLLLAYVAASVLKMIPITPGGLGFVEAGLTVTLVWAGLSTGNATLATLAYRLVSYWLPLIAGVAAAIVYRNRYPTPTASIDTGGGARL